MDIFFQSEYGKLYEQIENGVCETFEYKCSDGVIRNMYIKRPVPWLVDGRQYYDIITPYGYGGPIVYEGTSNAKMIGDYFKAWSQHCTRNNIVAEFVRFHLFDNADIRQAFPGATMHISDNVVRTLNVDIDELWMEFEHKVRKNVKKAQSNGLTVSLDPFGKHLDEFMGIYSKTMTRNDAKAFYYFDRKYYESIINTLPNSFMFFHVWHNNTIISTELVLCSDKYVYSFLGGTLDEYYPMRPNDLLKYEIIRWSEETGHQAFILGGGYGGNDGIYKYKKAFAPNDDVPFYIGKKIWNENVYNKLIDLRKASNATSVSENFFPVYRG